MTSWATAADVQSLTGKVVEDSDVDMAQGVIELGSAFGLAASLNGTVLSIRNLDWLRRAVAYQAAFMVEYPDYFSRMDVASMSQDGVSATMRNSDAFVLAPLAKRCLKRLSWRGIRTINPSINRTVDRSGYRTSNAPDVPGIEEAAYTSSAVDDDLPWKAM